MREQREGWSREGVAAQVTGGAGRGCRGDEKLGGEHQRKRGRERRRPDGRLDAVNQEFGSVFSVFTIIKQTHQVH